jgi:hypothetical protein
MEWILVISSIVVILIGYLVIKKVELSVHQPPAAPVPAPLTLKLQVQGEGQFVLVFGKGVLADVLIQILKEHRIDHLQIEDQSQLDKSKDYTHVFALSSSDLDNILINTLVNRINRTHRKFALCNDPENEGIYKQSSIECIRYESFKSEILYQILFEPAAIQ